MTKNKIEKSETMLSENELLTGRTLSFYECMDVFMCVSKCACVCGVYEVPGWVAKSAKCRDIAAFKTAAFLL